MTQLLTHPGSCHCGAVRFSAKIDASAGSRCNCSACQKVGLCTVIVKPEALTLLAGEDLLTGYQWAGRNMTRFFCRACGITCFSRGHLVEVGGDFVSLSLNSLDDVDVGEVGITYWDGRHDNWRAGRSSTPWPVFRAGEARPTS